jgi:hypothetical protein
VSREVPFSFLVSKSLIIIHQHITLYFLLAYSLKVSGFSFRIIASLTFWGFFSVSVFVVLLFVVCRMGRDCCLSDCVLYLAISLPRTPSYVLVENVSLFPGRQFTSLDRGSLDFVCTVSFRLLRSQSSCKPIPRHFSPRCQP